jgi:HSP20 family molecular chaperone IbpA
MDQDGIRAELKQGVLMLTLPKAAKAQPRAIPVNAV